MLIRKSRAQTGHSVAHIRLLVAGDNIQLSLTNDNVHAGPTDRSGGFVEAKEQFPLTECHGIGRIHIFSRVLVCLHHTTREAHHLAAHIANGKHESVTKYRV